MPPITRERLYYIITTLSTPKIKKMGRIKLIPLFPRRRDET